MRTPALLLVLGLVACVDPTVDETTAPDSYDGETLTVDIAPNEGAESIRATVAEVSVVDAKGAAIATIPAFEPQGSRDEVLGIRVFPQAYVDAPLIAVTTTVGGHRESATYTALYRLQGRHLDTLFIGVVEEVSDETVASGSLLVLPATILYRAPHAELATVLSFDATARRYVAR